MVHVIVFIKTKPGRRDETLEAFRANVPTVRAEAGCIQYEARVDFGEAGLGETRVGEDTFVVVEKWESLDALKDHMASPHMLRYRLSVEDNMVGRTFHVLT